MDRGAHPTIIRYAYRYLAAMYHPDNVETGDAEKFRIITDAWRTLSDESRRNAYDMTLGVKDQEKAAASPQAKAAKFEFSKDSMPKFEKAGISWNEVELRIAILQILLQNRKLRPQTGGASAKIIMDILNIDTISEVEFALWYLREKGLIEMGERLFMITVMGVDYLTDTLSKTQILEVSKTEEKVSKVVAGTTNLPARPAPPTR